MLAFDRALEDLDILLGDLPRSASFFGFCGGIGLVFTLSLDDLDLDLKKKKGLGDRSPFLALIVLLDLPLFVICNIFLSLFAPRNVSLSFFEPFLFFVLFEVFDVAMSPMVVSF